MKAYREYKDSEIEWVKQIPSAWEICKLKYTALGKGQCFIDGDWIESKDISTDGIRYLTSGNVGPLKYKEQGNGYITEETFRKLECKDVYEGDILISRLNEPISRACIVPNLNSRIVTCVDNVIYRPDSNRFNKKFIVYVLNCTPYTENANLSARGVTMHRVSRTMLGNFYIPVPSIAEQEAIASFLDAKTKPIDDIIAKREKQIELLEEMKSAIVSRAVTKGLNPNAKMKDSGIEWIKTEPQSWETRRIKNVITLLTDYDANGSFADIAKNVKVNVGEPYAWMVRATDLANKRYGIVDDNNYCNKETYDFLSKSSLEAGDILIAKRGDIGKSYEVPKCDCPMTLAPNTYLLKTNKKVIRNRFFHYFFMSDYGKKQLSINNKSTTIGAIYKDDVKNLKILLPPMDEQQAIASYLDSETSKIDTRIAKRRKQIELLQEYKQALITAAVTGKIDVREYIS